MKKFILVLSLVLAPALCLADGVAGSVSQANGFSKGELLSKLNQTAADVKWVGGGLRISDETKPLYTADLHADLGQVEGVQLFAQPLIGVRGEDALVNLGFGGRTLVQNGKAVAGANLFFDWNGDNHQQRLGFGGEYLTKQFSANANVYLPLSGRHDGQKAVAGLDASVGVPIPGYEFIAVRPGIYFYNGHSASDMRGVSLALEARPCEALDITMGARNDALDGGRGDAQVFAQIRLTYSLRQLGRDIMRFDRHGDLRSQTGLMDARVYRETGIAFER